MTDPEQITIPACDKCADCGGAGEKPLFTSCYQCETCGGSGLAPRDHQLADVVTRLHDPRDVQSIPRSSLTYDPRKVEISWVVS